jgi:hypothetical protein
MPDVTRTSQTPGAWSRQRHWHVMEAPVTQFPLRGHCDHCTDHHRTAAPERASERRVTERVRPREKFPPAGMEVPACFNLNRAQMLGAPRRDTPCAPHTHAVTTTMTPATDPRGRARPELGIGTGTARKPKNVQRSLDLRHTPGRNRSSVAMVIARTFRRSSNFAPNEGSFP